jgi:lipid II:glycine glycyltransferase (peptidoglycan interpeptide bridge formation enzyme)
VAETEIALRSDLEATGFHPLDMSWSYWNQPKYVMLLPLSEGKEGILRSLDRKDRYKIRHAAKDGVVFEQAAISRPNIAEFHRLMARTASKKGIPIREARWYFDLLNVFGLAGHAALFLARKDQESASAGISIRMGPKAWLLHLASDYSTGLANWGLMWNMVSWAVDSGCALYDFRGTATNYPPSPRDKGYGVYRFKKSFGARLTPLLGYFDLVLAPARYRAFRYAERRLLPLGERALEAFAALRRIRTS